MRHGGAQAVNASFPASFAIELNGRRWNAGSRRYDLSIPLEFGGAQPNFFDVPRAAGTPLVAGEFVGSVDRGGSCNCASYSLTPHCNGTHTECVGHITSQPLNVRELLVDSLLFALLVTVQPKSTHETNETSTPPPQPNDLLITSQALEFAASACPSHSHEALIIRSLPNDASKRTRRYGSADGTPYFSVEAMQWIVAHGVRHLVVDLPSVDRGNDDGRLTAHRIFWNVPSGAKSVSSDSRMHATITELAYIDNSVADGEYLLNLQIAPFASDAAPSRPILLSLELL